VLSITLSVSYSLSTFSVNKTRESEKEKEKNKSLKGNLEPPQRREGTTPLKLPPQRVDSKNHVPRALKVCVKAESETGDELDRTKKAKRRNTHKEKPD